MGTCRGTAEIIKDLTRKKYNIKIYYRMKTKKTSSLPVIIYWILLIGAMLIAIVFGIIGIFEEQRQEEFLWMLIVMVALGLISFIIYLREKKLKKKHIEEKRLKQYREALRNIIKQDKEINARYTARKALKDDPQDLI